MIEPLRRARNALVGAAALEVVGGLLALGLEGWALFGRSGGAAGLLNDSDPTWQVLSAALLAVLLAGVIFLIAWGWFSVAVIRALARGKNWAWVAALVQFGFYATSLLFLPFAIYGVIMLLKPEARAACGAAPRTG